MKREAVEASDSKASRLVGRLVTRRAGRARWLAASAFAAGGIAVALTGITVGQGPSATPRVAGATLTAASSPTCSAARFCVTGGAVANPLYPAGPKQVLPLSFINPYNVPITITTLQVAFTNTFPSGCASSAFQVNGIGATGTPPSVTISPNLTVASATASGPTAASYTDALLGLADQGNQNACQSIPLSLSYTAAATYNYTNCITGSQSKAIVTSGQVLCVAKTGKVTGGITVQSGGVLYVNGGSISGGVSASGPAGINLCAANITGGASISGSVGEVVIGDGQSCGGGSITGGLSVTNGTAGVQIIGNSISGGLTVSGNSGSIPGPSGTGQFVETNTVTGGFTCTPNNTPALNDGGSTNRVSGPRTGTQCSGSF